MNRPPSDHIRRFMSAIRSERCLVSDAARLSGLTLPEAAEVWAYGITEGKLELHDGGLAERWIQEVSS